MNLFDWISGWFSPPGSPLLRLADVIQLAARHPYSQYLPYETYDEARREYGNNDHTAGYLWECRPLAFLTDKAASPDAADRSGTRPPCR
jgi:hypothetical protein